MRNRGLPFLFEIKIPNVPIYQSDYQRRAQQDRRCADMVSPGGVDAVNGDSGVERQNQAEKAKQQAKAHSRAAFQEPAHAERDKKRSDEYDRCDRISLCLRHCVKHRGGSISEGDPWNSILVPNAKDATASPLARGSFTRRRLKTKPEGCCAESIKCYRGAITSHAQPARQ